MSTTITHRRPRPALILALALLPWVCCLSPSASVRARVSAAVYCGAPVAVLGADLTDAGRREVATVLGLTPATRQLTETLDDERVQAHGLIPPDLLGQYAISSVVLRPLPAGSGLTVTLRRAIRLDVAENYVNALLTLGVTDARVDVAAPYAQAALGTTALLGLIRAARSACTGISPAQADLAIRGGVLNTALGANVAARLGYQVTPRLLFTLKLDAVAGHVADPTALAALIARDSAALGTTVPPETRPALVAFLHDLVVGGAFAEVAAARPIVVASSIPHAQVRLSGAQGLHTAHGAVLSLGANGVVVRQAAGVQTYHPPVGVPVSRDGRRATLADLRPSDRVTVTTDASGTVVRIDATSAPVPTRHGAVVHGVVSAAANAAGLAVRQADGPHAYRPAPAVPVYRDGKPVSLAALQPGDKVTITTAASGAVTRIDATSAHPVSAPGTPGTPGTTGTQGHGAVAHGVLTAPAGAAGLPVAQNDGIHGYRPGPATAVYRNGARSSLGALQPGDTVTVTTDAAGAVTRIDAFSGHPGSTTGGATGHAGVRRGVLAVLAGAAGLVLHDKAGAHTYAPAADVPVYRNGGRSSLGALQPGDAIAVTTDAAGAVTRIDATGPASGVPVPAPSGQGHIVHGVVTGAVGLAGLPVRLGGGLHTYHPSSDVPVYRNGARSSIGAIQPGDHVAVTTNAAGRVTRIDATSAPRAGGQGAVYHGIVTVAATGAVAGLGVRQDDGLHTYHPAATVPVYRNGVRATIGALRPTDRVTVVTNATGAVTRIDASSVSAPARPGAGVGTGTAHGQVVRGVIAATAGGAAITVRRPDGPHTYHPSAATRVYRNGARSSASAIRPGDTVTVTTDPSGAVTRIDAVSGRHPARPATGTVVRGVAVAAAVAAGIVVQQGGARHTYRPTAGTVVYRNGKRAAVGAIRPGDALTITQNPAGAVTRIDARSAPAPAPLPIRPPAPANPHTSAPAPVAKPSRTAPSNAALALIPLLALLGLLLLLLARRRRRVVTTTTVTTTTIQPLGAVEGDDRRSQQGGMRP